MKSIYQVIIMSACMLLPLHLSAQKVAKVKAATPATAASNFWTVVKNRTSVRSYEAKKVSRADLEDIVRAGMAAPTAVNRQPWQFVVVTDEAQLKQLADSMPRNPMLRTAPAIIIVCGDMQKALQGPAQQFWIQDCSAASENILLAITAKGLGGVWTALYPDQNRIAPVRSALALPDYIIPLNIIVLGYPKGPQQPKDKWKPENVHWDKW